MLVQGLQEIRAKTNMYIRVRVDTIGFEPELKLTVRDMSQNRADSMRSVPDLRVTSRDPRCCKIYGLQIKKQEEMLRRRSPTSQIRNLLKTFL